MKSRILQTIVPVLLVMTLAPALGWAQAEINPDHFDNSENEQVSRVRTIPMANQAVGSFHGRFTLLYQVTYAGLTLSPGTYSLSIQSRGSWVLITLIPQGTAARIQTRAKSPSGASRPTALVLERSGQQRTLTSISLQKPGMVLHLQGAQSRTATAESELVPILQGTRTVRGN